MKSLKLKTGICLALALCCSMVDFPAGAEVEWSIKKQLNLDVAPMDIVSSPDGQWVYVLAPGEVLLYSMMDNKVVNRIPVEKTFDRLAYSAPDNTLILSGSTGKMLKFIQLEVIQRFSTDGLPFKGPQKAAATIAVFSDYQ